MVDPRALPPKHLLDKYTALPRFYAIMKSGVYIGTAHLYNQYATVYGTENEIRGEERIMRSIQPDAVSDIVGKFETLEELHAHPVYQKRFEDKNMTNRYFLDTVIHLPLSIGWGKTNVIDGNGNELVLVQDRDLPQNAQYKLKRG